MPTIEILFNDISKSGSFRTVMQVKKKGGGALTGCADSVIAYSIKFLRLLTN